jgi:hypothetical protein
VIDRAAEAIRRGATMPLLAWAVNSPKARASTPWGRIAEAGETAAAVLAGAREMFRPPHFADSFEGRGLDDLWTWIDARPDIRDCPRKGSGPLARMLRDLDALWRQARNWPPAPAACGRRQGGAA